MYLMFVLSECLCFLQPPPRPPNICTSHRAPFLLTPTQSFALTNFIREQLGCSNYCFFLNPRLYFFSWSEASEWSWRKELMTQVSRQADPGAVSPGKCWRKGRLLKDIFGVGVYCRGKKKHFM